MGRDFCECTRWYKTFVGQRFYYLEIQGARIIPAPTITPVNNNGTNTPPPPPRRPSDIQGIINFNKAEVRINYFFSEADAITVGSKLQRNDYAGAAISISYAIRNTLNGILLRDVKSKVKVIHEAMPELYLENYEPNAQQFAPLAALGGVAASVGKDLLVKLLEKLVEKFTAYAVKAVENYFRARAGEFLQAQKNNANGVTVKIIWFAIPGMSAIAAVINAVKGNLSVGNLANLALPSLPVPDVRVLPGKQFD